MNTPTASGHVKDSYSSWFLRLVALSVTTIITSNVIALTQWVMKCLYETLLTPVTYVVVNFLKRRERLDTYDYAMSFNSLSLD